VTREQILHCGLVYAFNRSLKDGLVTQYWQDIRHPFSEGGRTILATLKPTTLLAMFNSPQLEGVAQEVEATIVKIMKEAASG